MPEVATIGRKRFQPSIGDEKAGVRLRTDALRAWLEHRGWTAHRLSIAMGIAPTQMSDVLRGKRNPGARFIAALLLVTKKPFRHFFEVEIR